MLRNFRTSLPLNFNPTADRWLMSNLRKKDLFHGILLAIICIVFCLYKFLTNHHHRRIPIDDKKLISHEVLTRHKITEGLSENTPMDLPQHPSPPPILMNQTHIWGLPMEPVYDSYPENIYFSVKTTHRYYSTRLLDLLLTWCQAVDKSKVSKVYVAR